MTERLTHRHLLPALLAVLILFALAGTARAQRNGDETIHLPMLTAGSASGQSANCNVPGASYQTMGIIGDPTDRPAAEHPDLNLTIRGWIPSTAPLRLVSYGPTEDTKAPQFDNLFQNQRLPRFTSAHSVRGWDWGSGQTFPPPEPYPTLLGLATTPGEVLGTPDSGYDIGGGNDVLVLYATSNRLTLKYTREDNVVAGYTIHLENVCVEPDLLALYNQMNAAGRRSLPVLRGGQPIGRAAGSEILVAIRDTGAFLDPRSRNDWWAGH